MRKKALIVANLIGFVGFLMRDIRMLQDMGYEVVFAACDDGNSGQRETLKQMNVRFVPISLSSKNPLSSSNVEGYRIIAKLLKEENFALLHCHTPIAGFLARFAGRKYRRKGMKVIYTTHGLPFAKYSSFKQWHLYHAIEWLASRYTDLIITINQEDLESASKLCCRDVRKINGVGVVTSTYRDVEVHREQYLAGLGLPTDKIMVLSVGELSQRKNHQVIIRALAELQDKDNYIYVICGKEAGSSGVAQELEALAEECGVALYLLGHRNDIPQIMHCSDIGAIPSIREGLGLAGVQSLCAGVPLLGTPVQGISEYIKNGVSGYLYDPFDVKGYAEGIRLLSDPERRKNMRSDCIEIAKNFDMEIATAQIQEIYRSLLQDSVEV